MVSRAELEARLESVRAEVANPLGGIFGPSSIGWEVNREAVLFVGAGAASLLQLAHPFVAEAIAKQSSTQSDPLGRFARTFDAVYRIVFGDLDHAFDAARRVHRIHERIRGAIDQPTGPFGAGAPYAALDQDALFWVHATLVQTAFDVFTRIVRPLDEGERNVYVRESNRFAALFGIAEDRSLSTWVEFERVYETMLGSGRIAVSDAARAIAEELLKPRLPALVPIAAWLRVMTAGLLPPALRDAYGLRFDPRDRAWFERSFPALRLVRKGLPDVLRFVPAYHDAVWRAAGRHGRSRRAILGERAAQALPKLFGART